MHFVRLCLSSILLLVFFAAPQLAHAQQPNFFDEASAFEDCKAELEEQTPDINRICWEGGVYTPCGCSANGHGTGTSVCTMSLWHTSNTYGTGNASNKHRGFLCNGFDQDDAAKVLGQEEQCGMSPEYQCANPINLMIGNKFQTEHDFDGPGALDFVRYYNSHPLAPNATLGPRWSHTYAVHVDLPANSIVATVHLSHGRQAPFTYSAGAWQAGPESQSQLIEVMTAGERSGWQYIEHDAREIHEFDADGRLIAIRRTGGASVTLVYNHGQNGTAEENRLLTSVTDERGRSLTFAYDANHRLVELTDASGFARSYGYDAKGRLTTVGTLATGVRTYVYNESSLTGGEYRPYALTGIIDENGARFANFGYNTAGMAILSEHAGGVERFEISYDLWDGSRTVLTPLGVTQSRETVAMHGIRKVASVTETCTGCTPRTRAYSYDAQARLDQATDENGVVTDYNFDSAGRLAQVTEGANDSNGDKRTVQMDWDADFDVPTERRIYDAANTLVGKETWTYNPRGQALTASQVDPTTAAVRTTTFAYCEAADVAATNSTCPLLGLPKSVDGPLAGSTDTTTFVYRPGDDLAGCATIDSGNCHRKGDLWKVVDALGNESAIERYDLAGQPTQARDPNGVVTRLTFDPRGRVTQRTVFGPTAGVSTDDAITVVAYDAVGQVVKVTQPDGAFVAFTYDAAHRLEQVEDSLGNTIDYALDVAGNPYQEETRDSAGVLRKTLSRLFDGFGQLESLADAGANATDVTYDATGAVDTVTDPLGRITDYSKDALGRLRGTIANTAGTGSQRAVSQFEVNALDQLTAVIDPKGLTTSYGFDGFGNLSALASPDTGTTTYGHDAAGNRTSAIDARGVQSIFAYDRLHRLTGIDRPSAGQDVVFAYDTVPGACQAGETFGIGRLGTMTDSSGSTQTCYDRRGNTVRKVQAVNGLTPTRTVGYSYNAADRVVGMTYPSGATVSYTRDANGRIVGVTAQPTAGAAAVTIVADVDYLPFGPLNVLTFGNGRTLTKSYEQNYGIDAVTDSAAGGLAIDLGLDDVGNVTAISEHLAGGATAARSLEYDALDRLTALKNAGATQQGFSYDATGNRLTKASPATTNYTYASTSHRLTATAGTARTYDAAGNTLTNGVRFYTYDDSGRMVQYGQSGAVSREYLHTGRGERVAKTVPGSPNSATYFVHDESGHLIGEYNAVGARVREYIWLDDVPVAVLSSHGGTTYQYLLTDHLNTPRAVVLPTTNTIVWRWDLTGSAFGDHLAAGDPDGNGTTYTLPLRYPGQYHDAESGLFYNYFRTYDPATGRYLQSDPVGQADGLGIYAYVSGNPFGYVDGLGLNRRTVAITPPPTTSQLISGPQVARLIREIHIYEPTFRYQTTGPTGYRYNRQDVEFLNGILGQHQARFPNSCVRGELNRIDYGSTPGGLRLTRHYSTERVDRNIPVSLVDYIVRTMPGRADRGAMVHYDPINDVTVVMGRNGVVTSHRGK